MLNLSQARLVALFVARLAGGAQTRDDATQVTRAPDGPDASLQGSHSIYCEGSLPSRWQRVLYSDQTGVHIAAFNTPRKFCAKVSYGGNSAFNLGAYFYPLFGQIALERNLRTHMDQRSRPIQDSDRVFCTLRCRAIPPPPEEVLYDISYARFQLPYLEDPNMQSLRYTIVPPEVVHAPTRQVRVLTSREADDARALGRQYAFSFENIKAAPQYGTNLRCRGPLPPDPWPAPFNAIDPEEIDEQSPDKPFDSITKMCAALWFGGDARGNAGMTCRIGPEGQTVLTMESYLAHPALYRANPRGGMFIDFWCHRACDCPQTDEEVERPLRDRIPLIELTRSEDGNIYFHQNNLIEVRRTNQRGVQSYRVGRWSEGDANGRNHTSSGDTEEVDTDLLQDLMTEKPDPFFPFTEGSAPPPPGQCGRSCSGPADCGSNRKCGACVYKPSKRLIQTSGLGSFLPIAISVCLSIASERYKVGGRELSSSETINGRLPNPLQEQVTCVCNTTYTSPSCCGAPTGGIVFEDTAFGTGPVEANET